MESNSIPSDLTARWQSAMVTSQQPQALLSGLYGASIAIGSEALMRWSVQQSRKLAVPRTAVYEIAVQSHLFLGFPRTLTACELLQAEWPERAPQADPRPSDLTVWEADGKQLAGQVYGSVFERLTSAVAALSPEIGRWMIIDGYGKVLARPGLSMEQREYAIIAMLVIDDQPVQLFSHLRGALRLGCLLPVIEQLVTQLAPLAPDAARRAEEQLQRIRERS